MARGEGVDVVAAIGLALNLMIKEGPDSFKGEDIISSKTIKFQKNFYSIVANEIFGYLKIGNAKFQSRSESQYRGLRKGKGVFTNSEDPSAYLYNQSIRQKSRRGGVSIACHFGGKLNVCSTLTSNLRVSAHTHTGARKKIRGTHALALAGALAVSNSAAAISSLPSLLLLLRGDGYIATAALFLS